MSQSLVEKNRSIRGLWMALWAVCLAVGVVMGIVYVRLPVDGMTGDLGSFTSEGFRLQWVLEARDNGLRVDDVIVRAGGRTVEEWLAGAPLTPEWKNGGTVRYEVLRDGALVAVDVKLFPVSLVSVLKRWALQLVVGAAFLLIGTFVFLKRMSDPAARDFMIFCVLTALHYWGDGFNFQFSIIPWRSIFWFHFVYEQATYTFALSAICRFAVVFPVSHSLQTRYPRLIPLILYAVPTLVIGVAVLVPSSVVQGVIWGNRMGWIIAVIQVGIAVAGGVYSVRHTRDPITRAQVRWILYCAALGIVVLMPAYVFPLAVGARPFFPHPVMMVFIVLLPLTLAFDILRLRLFDIEIILNRTLVYTTLTALLVGIYFVLVRMLTVIVEAVVHRPDNTLAVVIAAVASSFGFVPLRWRIQRFIDRAFYRARIDFQRLLPEMSEHLSRSIDLERLLDVIEKELPEKLQVSWAKLAVLNAEGTWFVSAGVKRDFIPADHHLAIQLRDGKPLIRLQPPPHITSETLAFLEQGCIELCIPLLAGEDLVGICSLGMKRSTDAYSRDEVRLLGILGKEAGIAFQNARLFERAQAEIAERKKTEDKLVLSLREKEVLIKEVHHRVKNNLQIISSLLYLQSKNVTDPKALESFRDSSARVQSISLVHEMLYKSADLTRIDLSSYVKNLTDSLLGTHGVAYQKVEVSLDVNPIAISLDSSIACGLILNELIFNSLKHAFADQEKGRIRISISFGSPGTVVMIVSDDGRGFPADIDFRDTKSLGLQIVNIMVHKLNGKIELERDGGTSFRIEFPENAETT